ncbi:hypothetical protein GBA65_20470 [Rubrobacter marinus]|uniref:Uncharacterized protein n=1 Tax=Rubrobacter marinus TaxID=2653852 RepID=A0A6G8Q2F4_9ACTN|nr:hypothetical protein [Rubrobacter marinus]QIN80497.1 hypothetical protein GBA65_20470 [Rubrobacter marinus]
MEDRGRRDGDQDFGEIEARYYLGNLPPDEMPGIALRALEAGYDGPALLGLARMSEPTMQDAGPLFERALGEVGLSPLPAKEAGLRVAGNVARKMVSGEVRPYEGAYLIWTKLWMGCGRPAELTPFVGLASLYEADPERRPFHDEEILARAEELARKREER